MVFTYKAGPKEARLYYDGSNRATFSLGDLKNVDFSGDAPLVLGEGNGVSECRSFPGVIDELRVWNSALSRKEVLELYKQYAIPSAVQVFDKEVLAVLNWNIWHGGTHYTVTAHVYETGVTSPRKDRQLIRSAMRVCIALDYAWAACDAFARLERRVISAKVIRIRNLIHEVRVARHRGRPKPEIAPLHGTE